jgi:hypothetical protein
VTASRERRVAALMVFEAATLAVMAFGHLSGSFAGGSPPFQRVHAGIAESIIGVALVCGAVSLVSASRRVALATIGFAIAGFIIGLNFTIRGGDAIDIAYHATVLPLLVVTLVALLPLPGSLSVGRGAR